MNLQRREEGCRRILAAVANSWGHPEGWSFRVSDRPEANGIVLSAHYLADGQKYECKLMFTYEDITHCYGEEQTDRKVLRLYRESLRAIGRAT